MEMSNKGAVNVMEAVKKTPTNKDLTASKSSKDPEKKKGGDKLKVFLAAILLVAVSAAAAVPIVNKKKEPEPEPEPKGWWDNLVAAVTGKKEDS